MNEPLHLTTGTDFLFKYLARSAALEVSHSSLLKLPCAIPNMHPAYDGGPDTAGGREQTDGVTENPRELHNPRRARLPAWTIREIPDSPGCTLILNIAGRPQIVHHHVPKPIRFTSTRADMSMSIVTRAMSASAKAMAEAREVDSLIERAVARSTDIFDEETREAPEADGQLNSTKETLHKLPYSSGTDVGYIGQRSELQHAPGDSAATTEGNRPKQHRAGARSKDRYRASTEAAGQAVLETQLEAAAILQEREATSGGDQVNHLPSTESLTQQGSFFETGVSDAPRSLSYERQAETTGDNAAHSGAGVQLVSISSDDSLLNQPVSPIQMRVKDMSQTEPGYSQTPTKETAAQESQVGSLPDVSSSHVTLQQSNVSATQAIEYPPIPKPPNPLDEEVLPADMVHVSVTPVHSMCSQEDPSVVESFTDNLVNSKRPSSPGAAEREESVKKLKAEPEVRTTRRQRQNARVYAKRARRKAQLAAVENAKLVKKQGEESTRNGQKGLAKHEDLTSYNCAIAEGLQAPQEPKEWEKIQRGHDLEEIAQSRQDDAPKVDLQLQQEKANKETTQKDKSNAKEEPGASLEDLQIQQEEVALKESSQLEHGHHSSVEQAQYDYDNSLEGGLQSEEASSTKEATRLEENDATEEPALYQTDLSLGVEANRLRDISSDVIERITQEGITPRKDLQTVAIEGAMGKENSAVEILDPSQSNGATEQAQESMTAQDIRTLTSKDQFKKKRGLGRVKRLKKEATAARMALEEADNAEAEDGETSNTEGASVETTNVAGPENGSGEDSRLEATAKKKRPDKRTRMKLQQQTLEVQQVLEESLKVQQSVKAQQAPQAQQAQQALQAQKAQVAQYSFIYDAIEKTDIPHNLSQLEAIASRFADHFGQVKQTDVPLRASSHNQSHHDIQTPHENLHNAIQRNGMPQNLDQLQSMASRFAKFSTKVVPSNFLCFSSSSDAAHYGRMIEDTGLPLAHLKNDLEYQRRTLLPLLQAGPPVLTTATLAHGNILKDMPASVGNTEIAGIQADNQLRHQDALLSLLNFAVALPITAKYTYTNVLAEASSNAIQAYSQSAPYVQDNSAAVESSSLSVQGHALSTVSKKALRKAAQEKKMGELEKRLRALEVENRFLKGMRDEDMYHEARVQL
jgi:hypothetical protein